MNRRMLLLLPIVLAIGCTKVYNDNPAPAPTPVVEKPAVHVVEYRVTGTATVCKLTTTSTVEGLEVIDTGLPWFRQFNVTKNTYLYLDAEGQDFGTVHIQIFVDGILFREAFSNVSYTKIVVSGTYYVSSPLSRTSTAYGGDKR